VTPPFKPVVESDESTANFDPEFTSADISDFGAGQDMDLDDNDPSGDWVSKSVTGSMHMPNGPLGSERPGKNIDIKSRRQRRDVAGSPPLTKSMQENFRGFTYSGEGESLNAHSLARYGQEVGEEAVEDEDVQEPTTEDEAADSDSFAGRYSRRKGLTTYFDDEMHM